MLRMGTLKTEFTQFNKFGGHSHRKDVLMKKLIFEREIKGMRTWKGDDLSRGHYESSKIYFPLRTNVFSYPDPSVAGPEVSFIQSN